MTREVLIRFLNWIQSPGESLQQRVLHGGVWTAFLNISDRGLQILRLIILAHFLSPTAFGLLGIALLVKQALIHFTEIGIQPALIQQEADNIDGYLDTAWTLNIARGIGVCLLVLISAPSIAIFFGEPRAEAIIQVLSISALLEGVVNPAVVYFKKDLNFHKQYIFRICGAIADFIVAVTAAILLQNVWALVYGLIVGQLVRVLVSYILVPYKPAIAFEENIAKEMFSFGKWVWVTSIITFLATTGDDSFVGWYLSAGALGLYQMAFRLSNAPATEITGTITTVAFPAFSKLQNKTSLLRTAFLRTITLISIIGIPMATGIVLVAPVFTLVILGNEWTPMVTAMQIMAIAGLLRAYVKSGGALFQGVGYPNWDFKMNLIRTIAISITIWPLTALWGINGSALSITIGIGMSLPILFYKSGEITDVTLSDYLHQIYPSLIGSSIMAIPVWYLLNDSLLSLIIAILVGIVVYSASVTLVYLSVGRNPLQEILDSG